MNLNYSSITFDIDWAPEWSIQECIDLCREYRVPATFFSTHASLALEQIVKDPQFEIGIHPNFKKNSTQGRSEEEVLDNLIKLVPNATSMRTHSLIQSSELLQMITQRYPQIQNDVSLFLPLHPALAPVELFLGENQHRLIRLPYFWEDDVYCCDKRYSWDNSIPISEGLKIFDFHPIHISLNTSSLDSYHKFKMSLGDRLLPEVSRKDCAAYVNQGSGTKTFFSRLLADKSSREFSTISHISKTYQNMNR